MISFTLAPTAIPSRWCSNSTTREDEYRYVHFRETQLVEERRHWQQDFPHHPNSTSNSASMTEHSSMNNVIMQYRESQTATSGSDQRRNSTSGIENDETDSGLAQLGDLYLSESQRRRSYTRYTVPSPYTPAVRPQHHLPAADGYTSPTPTSDDRSF
ncbi:hypothetical protein [Absidia glauca]|uniref:Uncharacterized protein n=1 Tax=Absidia glauca TaxID=4829 RepID=A0A163K0J8_ABSGL|nr:hypothetical protein [Absidia glauca]